MENFENKTGMGRDLRSEAERLGKQAAAEAERLGKQAAAETERFGKRVADKVGNAVGTAGQKLDQAIDYVDSTAQTMRDSFNKIREEGWNGLRTRTIDYTRREPMTALCIAMTAGILVGWLTKRVR